MPASPYFFLKKRKRDAPRQPKAKRRNSLSPTKSKRRTGAFIGSEYIAHTLPPLARFFYRKKPQARYQ